MHKMNIHRWQFLILRYFALFYSALEFVVGFLLLTVFLQRLIFLSDYFVFILLINCSSKVWSLLKFIKKLMQCIK